MHEHQVLLKRYEELYISVQKLKQAKQKYKDRLVRMQTKFETTSPQVT